MNIFRTAITFVLICVVLPLFGCGGGGGGGGGNGGASWSTPVSLEDFPLITSQPQIAGDGAGEYIAVWKQNAAVWAALFNGSWNSAVAISTGASNAPPGCFRWPGCVHGGLGAKWKDIFPPLL